MDAITLSAIALTILGVIFSVVVGPLCVIWAINTLFVGKMLIPYTLETWCAAAILCNIFTVKVKKD
jgi:hypothetical protein